ncbi:MAG: amino acid ABC transporter permease [Rhodospirillales bacterium]
MLPFIKKLGPISPHVHWVQVNFFDSAWSSFLTILVLYLLYLIVPASIEWGVLNATWLADSGEACRDIAGACWAVIPAKYRVMFFGIYPYEEHWRPTLAMGITGLAWVMTCTRTFWKPKLLAVVWIVAIPSSLLLMWGGVFGLTFVQTSKWGGLPLTFFVFTSLMFLGMPLAVLFALGRQSKMPVIKSVCVFIIEVVRTIPIPMILFFAAVVLPLFLAPGVDVDQLFRVTFGLVLFFACFQAEVLRGGLQAIPRGQYEAADSLGLSYRSKMFKIILPQVFRTTIPSMMNGVIGGFKDTTIVIVVGLFDLFTATQAALADPEWRRYFTEGFIFVALIYFLFTYAMSKYSQLLEKRFSFGKRD